MSVLPILTKWQVETLKWNTHTHTHRSTVVSCLRNCNRYKTRKPEVNMMKKRKRNGRSKSNFVCFFAFSFYPFLSPCALYFVFLICLFLISLFPLFFPSSLGPRYAGFTDGFKSTQNVNGVLTSPGTRVVHLTVVVTLLIIKPYIKTSLRNGVQILFSLSVSLSPSSFGLE